MHERAIAEAVMNHGVVGNQLVRLGLEDSDRLAAMASARNIPFKIVAPGDTRRRARYETRFPLIRPDQHVAWRGDELPADAMFGAIMGGSQSGASAKMPAA